MRTPCRVCKGSNMKVTLDIGEQPLANNYVTEPCEQPKYPLILTRCLDCTHTQQDFDTPPTTLFSNYQYTSSKALSKYFSWMADHVIEETRKPIGTVLEIGANNGAQLDEFSQRGWKTYGVDPAQNIVDNSKHDIRVGFWGTDTFDFPVPDVIVAQNACAHVPDPVKFLKACKDAMGLSTLLYVQTSQCDMYTNGEFDTIYHEHFSFFTIKSMKKAAELAGLTVSNVIKTPMHGNSFMFTMRRTIEDPEIDFDAYSLKIEGIKTWVRTKISEFIDNGYTVVAYGAAAKGMTLMNYFDIADKIDYIVDDSPMKQGKYTPSSNIKIVKPEVLYEDTRKMAVLILAWNFSTEITVNIHINKTNGTTMIIIPYPNQKILEV